MSSHPTDFQGSVTDAIREAIVAAITIEGGGGHFTIEVTSSVFAGKSRVESQRLVYSAITHLMRGDLAPVHAVDSLRTHVP
jgi:acid stress-induced BolA-like protein IbaG/YrbA